MQVSDLAFIDAQGYHYSDFPTFLEWLQGVYKGIYGQDVYLGNDSQDGQFIAAVAQALYDTAALGATNYSSFAPGGAVGVGLARLVKINGIKKEVATKSTVDVVLIGTNGTPIIDCIATDNLNQQWIIPATTIPFAGTITVTATAALPGAVAALPNTITNIFTPTQGWQSVNNPAAATPGAPVETDAALRKRQAISTANPSSTVFEGTKGAVGNVTGVSSSQGYENPTASTDANGLPPHSISMVVEGGTDADVAEAIRIHKTPGTQTYGTTSVATTDSRGMPLTINFYRPDIATIGVQVTVTELSGFNPAFITQIEDAVSTYVEALQIGSTIVLTQLYPIAYLVGTPAFGTFNIVSIELKKNSGSFGSSNIALLFNEIPICAPSNVSVVT